MNFKRHVKLESGLKQIDIAPLIDVIFQLLIFFMLSSSFTFKTGINVKLPKAVTSDTIKEESYVITITGENVVYLNSEIKTMKELTEALPTIKETKRPLLIKADRRSSMGKLVDIWDMCRNLGIEKINIATNQDQ